MQFVYIFKKKFVITDFPPKKCRASPLQGTTQGAQHTQHQAATIHSATTTSESRG